WVVLTSRGVGGSTTGVMRLDITRKGRDDPAIPAKLSDIDEPNLREATITREFDFSYQRLGCGWAINGKPFDVARMDARPRLGATEIWRLKTDFSHPLHLHLVHFRVLSHSGRPTPRDS